jgi:hypothetical protein
MGPLHERAGVATHPTSAHSSDLPNGDEAANGSTPSAPQPLMGDCPAQQAIIPLLLLLSLLLAALTRTAGPESPGRTRPRSHPRDAIPPLLPAGQRRALLQVFRI